MTLDLPLVFTILMGTAVLAYVVLDGYDLGVGMLMPAADEGEQDVMVASIGPFWDANETWLVLGVGLLLVAFPVAHGVVLGALYLPVAAMLIGLMLRGVAFEFRVKAEGWHHELWNWLFWLGSFLASLAQGLMLGAYITGFEPGFGYFLFSVVVAGGVWGGHVVLGAAWLIWRPGGGCPGVWRASSSIRSGESVPDWAPFAGAVAIYTLAFLGLAYSIFPYVVMDQITIWQAAAHPSSLKVVLIGALIVLPFIIGWTAYVYRVFRGKAPAKLYE